MSAGDYPAMCKALLDNVLFSGVSPVGPPDGSPFDAGQLAAVVKSHQGRLPEPYRTSYAAPLLTALPDVVVQLRQQFDRSTEAGVPSERAMSEARAYADTLVGAVRDWGVDAYHVPLTRFEAVVSNLYRSFLGAEQRARTALPLIETLPPLVTFAPAADHGPFTVPADRVRMFTGAAIGVVSLPACYAQHPLLWAALAHETGGHDVMHADPGLLEQLTAGVLQLDGVAPALRQVWATWMDEVASDVYGILNIGPAFAVSLAAFFSALEASRTAPGEAPHALGTVNTILAVSGRGLRDAHPVDLLRLHAAMGAIDALTNLSPTRRAGWLALLDAIATTAAGGATAIDAYDADARAVVQHLPLATMTGAARAVGTYIATARLDALAGHSIQDIETWDDTDDTAAANIAAAAATSSIVAMGDDAQLLAGAVIALLNNPAAYLQITAQLNAALDDSFLRDPIFGAAMPQSALALVRRDSALARTPARPQFPLALD
jgi:hypothetical protein